MWELVVGEGLEDVDVNGLVGVGVDGKVLEFGDGVREVGGKGVENENE